MHLATPRLTPGLSLLRRSRGDWQLGLRRPIALPDSPGLRATFDTTGGQVVRAADADLVARLHDHGALVDHATSPVLRPAEGDIGLRAEARDRAATVARHGVDASQARHRRARPVGLVTHGPAADDVAAEVGALLARVGAGPLTTGQPGSPEIPVLVVSDGEPPREVADDLVRREVPHLFLRVVEADVLLGPWVVPGETACLRCDDLHRASVDPVWPLLVAQAAHQGAVARADDVASPADALAVTAAAAGAARDLVRHAEGLVPDAWSRELRWGLPHHLDADADQTERATRVLPRHAACGCSCWELAAGL